MVARRLETNMAMSDMVLPVTVTARSVSYTHLRCVYQNGEPVHLAKKEFDILELLSLHPSQVFARERIYESVWGWDSEGDSSVVAEHIRRSRAKLTAAGCGDRIVTVWGVGYKWQ